MLGYLYGAPAFSDVKVLGVLPGTMVLAAEEATVRRSCSKEALEAAPERFRHIWLR